MKKRFEDYGIPTPLSITTASLREAREILSDKTLPWILKPCSGSQGSLGVSIVTGIDELQDFYINAYNNSQDSLVVIEKYYNGREFSVDGIISCGKPIVLIVSEKFNLGYENNFTISGFAIGSISDEDHDLKKKFSSISDVALEAARSLEINNSFFSVDVLLTADGPIVIECGVLLDAKIDRLLYFAGVDVYEMICRVVAGERIEEASPKFQKGYALKFMFAQKEGKLKIVSDYDRQMSRNSSRILIEWERNNDNKVGIPKSIADTVGWVITEANDRKEAYRRATKISEEQHFQVI